MTVRLALAAAFVLLVVGCAGSDSGSDQATEDESSNAAGAADPPAPSEPDVDASEDLAEPTPTEPLEPRPPAGQDEEALRLQDPAELEVVVRAWSEALNVGDDEAAAELFAPEALVIQGDLAIALRTFEDAVQFNDGLPCSGHIVRISTESPVVTAVFELGDRPDSACDAEAGTLAAAQFLVEQGKIVIWRQIPVPGEDRVPEPAADVPAA